VTADSQFAPDGAHIIRVTAPANGTNKLIRAIGHWSLTALVINSVVGSGIFGLPSVVATYLGRASPLGYLLAAACMAVIMGCFAEVASQFSEAGGPYLYARVAFGRFLKDADFGETRFWPHILNATPCLQRRYANRRLALAYALNLSGEPTGNQPQNYPR